jgi:hypothetical protein
VIIQQLLSALHIHRLKQEETSLTKVTTKIENVFSQIILAERCLVACQWVDQHLIDMQSSELLYMMFFM